MFKQHAHKKFMEYSKYLPKINSLKICRAFVRKLF